MICKRIYVYVILLFFTSFASSSIYLLRSLAPEWFLVDPEAEVAQQASYRVQLLRVHVTLPLVYHELTNSWIQLRMKLFRRQLIAAEVVVDEELVLLAIQQYYLWPKVIHGLSRKFFSRREMSDKKSCQNNDVWRLKSDDWILFNKRLWYIYISGESWNFEKFDIYVNM